MRDDELSYRQVAALFDIRNFNIIGNWEHAYDEGGNRLVAVRLRAPPKNEKAVN